MKRHPFRPAAVADRMGLQRAIVEYRHALTLLDSNPSTRSKRLQNALRATLHTLEGELRHRHRDRLAQLIRRRLQRWQQ